MIARTGKVEMTASMRLFCTSAAIDDEQDAVEGRLLAGDDIIVNGACCGVSCVVVGYEREQLRGAGSSVSGELRGAVWVGVPSA